MTRSLDALLFELRSGKTSRRQVVDETFRNAAALNPVLNAFITLAPERAASQADSLTVLRRSQRPRLYGVPVAVKDSFGTAGRRTTCGSSALTDFVPTANAPLVDRLDRAGAILIGKTTPDEFGWGGSPEFGSARNPFAYDGRRLAARGSASATAVVAAGTWTNTDPR